MLNVALACYLIAYQPSRFIQCQIPILLEGLWWYYLTIDERITRPYISQAYLSKSDVIAQLAFELAFYDSAVNRFIITLRGHPTRACLTIILPIFTDDYFYFKDFYFNYHFVKSYENYFLSNNKGHLKIRK